MCVNNLSTPLTSADINFPNWIIHISNELATRGRQMKWTCPINHHSNVVCTQALQELDTLLTKCWKVRLRSCLVFRKFKIRNAQQHVKQHCLSRLRRRLPLWIPTFLLEVISKILNMNESQIGNGKLENCRNIIHFRALLSEKDICYLSYIFLRTTARRHWVNGFVAARCEQK